MVMPALMQSMHLKCLSSLCLEPRMPCLSSHREEALESAFIPGDSMHAEAGYERCLPLEEPS